MIETSATQQNEAGLPTGNAGVAATDDPSASEPVHLVTQRGQPYGSIRRCCEYCGRMFWPGMNMSARFATDDEEFWSAHEFSCKKVKA